MSKNITKKDYSAFDRPEILECVFHPRGDFSAQTSSATMEHFRFQVEDGVKIGGTLYHENKSAPILFFFHGNGEIVSDYEDLGPLFLNAGLNFFPVDYRGYGRSNGTPTVTAMMNDCHRLFQHARSWLAENGFTGPFIVMGRSLGSAPAIEIASTYQDDIDALIIESGFAYIMPLIRLLGIHETFPGVDENNGPKNFDKMRSIVIPTLIIHAEYDHIIPFSDGEVLYNNAGAASKQLVEIKGADHNNIFFHDFKKYMQGILALAGEVS